MGLIRISQMKMHSNDSFYSKISYAIKMLAIKSEGKNIKMDHLVKYMNRYIDEKYNNLI